MQLENDAGDKNGHNNTRDEESCPESIQEAEVVNDTVAGSKRKRAWDALKKNDFLLLSLSPTNPETPYRYNITLAKVIEDVGASGKDTTDPTLSSRCKYIALLTCMIFARQTIKCIPGKVLITSYGDQS